MLRDRLQKSAVKLTLPPSLLLLTEQELRCDDGDEAVPPQHLRGVVLCTSRGAGMPLDWRVTFLSRGRELVYVDDANVSKYGRSWCHLTADSLDELHAFAARIGLPGRAFHRGARHPHYDITSDQRLNALRSGARPVSPRDVVRITRQVFPPAPAVASSPSDAQLALFA